jgi:hypothetical protein
MNRNLWLAVLLLVTPSTMMGRADPDQDTAAVLAKLQTQRRDAARKTYEVMWSNYRERRASEDTLYRWSVRWLEAERQLAGQPAEQVAAFNGHVERMRELEKLLDNLHRSGLTTVDEISAAEFYRVEAEVWLLQAKEKKNP